MQRILRPRAGSDPLISIDPRADARGLYTVKGQGPILPAEKEGIEACVMAASLGEVVPAMKLGYVIDEFMPVKIGWRHGTGEMLVCDFRTTGWGARFADAALWIGCPDHAQRGGYKRRELVDHYFTQYLAAGGEEVPFETLLTETHALWQTFVLGGLNWWHDAALAGIESSQDEDKGRGMCRERLETDLTNLLRSLPGKGRG